MANKPIKIGVVDTGIKYPNHPAIKDNIVLCANFSYDGRKSTDIFSENTHGQAVASVITKVAPTVELVIAKALDDIGSCSSENAANGIRYCTALGCDIINCSIATNHSRKLEEAVKEANNLGILVVAASGNAGDNIQFYPCSYKETIGVGAMDNECKLADFSSQNKFVDILAPGVDVSVAYGKEGYIPMSGTSFATPLVSGTLAVLKEKLRIELKRNPTREELYNELINIAKTNKQGYKYIIYNENH